MTTALPPKVPLDMPLDDPAAIDEFVRSMAGAAHVLAVLAGDLEGPAATAPGWIGDDAAAAATQIGRVRDLVREVGGAVLIATGHLSAHADRLRDARRQVEEMQAEQDDDHAVAWSRWSELEAIRAEVQFDGAGAVAVVEDLRASEEARRQRHAALLAEVEDDAAATARTLVDACVVVGGTGRRGDDSRAVAHLASLLPGWGEPELAARGAAVGAALLGTYTSDATKALVEDAAAVAGQPAFASALLVRLGADGLRQLLELLGSGRALAPAALPTVLASALGAGIPFGPDGDRVEEISAAVYLHADDRFGNADIVATGMAVVLAAGRAAGSGPRPATVAAWARQMLLRENVTKADVGTGAASPGSEPEVSDAVALAVGILARSADPSASAALLGDKDVWQALLARGWNDGGAALAEMVTSAAAGTGELGARAVRSGLEVVGEGLFEGDPANWTVSRRTVDGLSHALGRALASQVEVAVDVLAIGVNGRLGGRESALRGLAYISVDSEGVGTVGQALGTWSSVSAARGTDSHGGLHEVAVLAGFMAAQEYGHRFSFVLDSFERKERAENSETWSNMTWGLLGAVAGELKGPWAGVGVGTDYLKIALGTDGTWDNLVDRGPRITENDAARAALAWMPPVPAADADMMVARARAAFEGTMAALGSPEPAISPDADLLEPVADAVVGKAGDGAAKRLKKLVPGGP